MQKMKKVLTGVFVSVMLFCICANTISVSAASAALREGSNGSAVSALQKDLKTLGFLSINPTGYYGNITESAVKRFQSRYGLVNDGIAGRVTLSTIDRLLGRTVVLASRASKTGNPYLVSWFGGAENIFTRGSKATIYDIDTGLSFNVKRTYGYNHADCETLTAADTAIMKKIYGGQWSWTRRAIIVNVNGRKIAASMAGMPHAGDDSQPGNKYVYWRSVGYGAGTNLDLLKGNAMDGHFDVHFLGSKTHVTNSVDDDHQNMVMKAAAWALKNY